MAQIVSDTIKITTTEPVSTDLIENEIKKNFGEVIRWAIVNCEENCFTVSFSYIKKLYGI